MEKQLYIINYENAIWCGGSGTVLVWATSEFDAEYAASEHMREAQEEMFGHNSYDDEDEQPNDQVSIISTELFDENHPDWSFYQSLTEDQKNTGFPFV